MADRILFTVKLNFHHHGMNSTVWSESEIVSVFENLYVMTMALERASTSAATHIQFHDLEIDDRILKVCNSTFLLLNLFSANCKLYCSRLSPNSAGKNPLLFKKKPSHYYWTVKMFLWEGEQVRVRLVPLLSL